MTEEKNSMFVQHAQKTFSSNTLCKKALDTSIQEKYNEAKLKLDSFVKQMNARMQLVLEHAKGLASDDEEDEYLSTIDSLRRDEDRMKAFLEQIDELEIPLHPYCSGCNREQGPHPSQINHMGPNGCMEHSGSDSEA